MVNFVEGIKRPFSDLKKFVIGVVIMLIPIVNIIAYGYGLKCAEMVLKRRGAKKLPKWEGWADLFIKGLIAMIISLIFFIPALIFLFLGIGFAATDLTGLFVGDVGAISTAFMGIGAAYLIILVILFLGAALLLPLGLMNYVKKWKFGDAFKFKELTKKVNSNYVIVWIVSLVYAAILGGILSYLPWIGPAIASFMAVVTTYGTWYAEAYMGK